MGLMIKRLAKKINDYASLVMFSHSLFSLPFGIIAMLWADKAFPPLSVFGWILVALFSARLGANALNRIIDRFIDAKNERTANRHLPTGSIKVFEVVIICLVCLVGLAIAAYKLNPTCLVLMPFAAVLLFVYSYTKRFTFLCHFVLGAACALAPVGAWIAIKGSHQLFVPPLELFLGWFSFTPLILGAAVCLYVAGFDIIYALQDIEFDRKEGLHSVPAQFGLKGGIVIASLSHAVSVLLFLSLYFIEQRGPFYLLAIVITAVMLFVQKYNAIRIYLGGKKKEGLRFVLQDYDINRIITVGFCMFVLVDFFILK